MAFPLDTVGKGEFWLLVFRRVRNNHEVLQIDINMLKDIAKMRPKVVPITNDFSAHYENTPIQIYRKFHLKKMKIFR